MSAQNNTSSTAAVTNDQLVIFDTTLRDGEQSPGASMTRDEKIRIAKMLEKMGVDVIEAGFAIASEGDFESIRAVAGQVKDSRICSLSRANARDIDRAAEALKPANASRIHTFIATSPIHMEYKLRMQPDAVLESAIGAVAHARNLTDDVEFSCEDASRSEFEFLCRIIEAVIDAGATTINLPDTVGYAEPAEYARMFSNLIEAIPNSDKAIFSVHCHNDLGLAVANSLTAVLGGARQIECTINGLGERAGNAALEEIVMAVRTRPDIYQVQTRIDTTHIVPTSRLVSSITGFPVQPNKAIVGANAFAHESGIHQDGVLKFRETYEIMRAEDVGWNANRLVLGKHSGRAAFRSRMDELRIDFAHTADFERAFERFKTLADKKHEIFDEDLQALVSDVADETAADLYKFVGMSQSSSTSTEPEAEVTVTVDGAEHAASAVGDGPVDAAFKALEKIVNSDATLLLFSINAMTEGTDAQADVTVRLEQDGRIVNGIGNDTDIVAASIKAYVSALNLLASAATRGHPQQDGI